VADETWDALLNALRQDNRSGATAITRRAAAGLPLAVRGADSAQHVHARLRRLATARPPFASLFRLADQAAEVCSGPFSEAELGRRLQMLADDFLVELDKQHQAIVLATAQVIHAASRILTFSASSVVKDALVQAYQAGAHLSVTCLESRPASEGVMLAKALASAGLDARIAIDAAAARLIGETEAVVVGADTLSPNWLIHKMGTLSVALAARESGVPVYALLGSLKLLPAPVRGWESDGGPDGELVEPAQPGLEVWNRYYDATPLRLLTGVVTEEGLIEPAQAAVAARNQALHRWASDLLEA
jgi:translation initiation factor 2B subunit (eIF-2B alpha/beta/delta family)